MVGWLWSYAHHSFVQSNSTDTIVSHLEEIQSLIGSEHMILDITAQDYKYFPLLRKLNDTIFNFAQSKNIKAIVTSWFYYPYEGQKKVYETALAIKDNVKTYNSDSRKVVGSRHILSEEEVRVILEKNDYNPDQIEMLISNTSTIANTVDITIELDQALFPEYTISDSIQAIYDRHKQALIQD